MYSLQTSRNQESNEHKFIPICNNENLVIIATDFFPPACNVVIVVVCVQGKCHGNEAY